MGHYAPLAERRVVGEGCNDRIRSRHIEWSTHRGAKGLVRVNDLINKYACHQCPTQDQGSPRRAVLLMLRRLESQCTGGSDGARESEEVKGKGGKREGGREDKWYV